MALFPLNNVLQFLKDFRRQDGLLVKCKNQDFKSIQPTSRAGRLQASYSATCGSVPCFWVFLGFLFPILSDCVILSNSLLEAHIPNQRWMLAKRGLLILQP